jgi:hypothetical protein
LLTCLFGKSLRGGHDGVVSLRRSIFYFLNFFYFSYFSYSASSGTWLYARIWCG